MEGSTVDAPHEKVAVATSDVRLGVIHTGKRYVYGFGPNFYGIWEGIGAGSPFERFPATPEGKLDGWRRFAELEPSAQQEATAALYVPPLEEVGHRRRTSLIVGAAVLVAAIVVAIVVVKSGKSGPGAASVAGAKKAHVDVTGSLTQSEDLAQEAFSASGVATLIPALNGTWSGQAIHLRIALTGVSEGDNSTNVQLNKRMDLTVNGTAFASNQGECTITVTHLEEGNASGTFACTGLKDSTGTQTIDAKGSFAGQS
jgi:hypothetical protein